MIRTMLYIGWLNLKRDRVSLGLSFVLPIVFFSLYASLFGGAGAGLPPVEVLVLDRDHSDVSARFVAALERGDGARVTVIGEGGEDGQHGDGGEDGDGPDRDSVRERLRRGEAPAALVVPAGFGAALETSGGDARIELYIDTSNPVAAPLVGGMVQRAAVSAVPDLLLARNLATFEAMGGPLSEQQRRAAERGTALLREHAERAAAGSASEIADAAVAAFTSELVHVDTVALMHTSPGKSSTNAFYAAGVAVLFLLFSATGVAGLLLEEEANGTLERLLCSELSMGRLLLGRWLFVTGLGVTQVSVMFLWGALAFDVDLFTPHHLAGFGLMTVATAASAAGFGLFLATLCRTRSQLDGVGTIVILIMSALGGSMFPRFLMPEWMKQVGLLTFNAWAVDGYQKVFWYEQPLLDLWPQLAVLTALSAAFLVGARLLARRWESV